MKYDEDSVLTQSKKRRVYKWIEKIRRERERNKAERDNKGVRKKRWKISWNGIKVNFDIPKESPRIQTKGRLCSDTSSIKVFFVG